MAEGGLYYWLRYFGSTISGHFPNIMKWLKRLGWAFCALLLLLAVAPFFVSLNDYIPQIEREASARLKEPVTIESLALALLPAPHFSVKGITVGNGDLLTLGKVTVTPDLWSLAGTPKVL